MRAPPVGKLPSLLQPITQAPSLYSLVAIAHSASCFCDNVLRLANNFFHYPIPCQPTNQLANSKEHSPTKEANSSSATKEILWI